MSADPQVTPSKTRDELQHAHDVLATAVFDIGDAPLTLSPETRDQMKVALSVLCWALGHGNEVFGANLAKCEQALAGHRFILPGNDAVVH